jgi:DNA-directed RNA polymerase subunit RPC12/RpoP
MKSSRKSNTKRKSPKTHRYDRAPQPSQRWAEQPVADTTGTIACPVCGHAVDAKRMHPHMVRFHAAHVGSKASWNPAA